MDFRATGGKISRRGTEGTENFFGRLECSHGGHGDFFDGSLRKYHAEAQRTQRIFFGRLKNSRTEDTETRSVFDGRCRKISHRSAEGGEEITGGLSDIFTQRRGGRRGFFSGCRKISHGGHGGTENFLQPALENFTQRHRGHRGFFWTVGNSRTECTEARRIFCRPRKISHRGTEGTEEKEEERVEEH